MWFADGFTRDGFSSPGELARAIASVGIVGAAVTLALAWWLPHAFSPPLAAGLLTGLAIAGRLVADALTRGLSHGTPLRAIVIGEPRRPRLEVTGKAFTPIQGGGSAGVDNASTQVAFTRR